MALKNGLPYEVNIESSINVSGYDGIVFISPGKAGNDGPEPLPSIVSKALKLDKALEKEAAVLEVPLPAERLVYVPVPLNLDFHDVRSFKESGKEAIDRFQTRVCVPYWSEDEMDKECNLAIKAGVTKPLVIVPTYSAFPYCQLVTILGVFEALYVNLQYREDKPEVFPKLKQLGLYSSNPKKFEQITKNAIALELARWVARDVGGPDPERMSPIKVEQYIREVFAGSPIKVEVISDLATIEKEFPLFAAVNRAANEIERHRGRIILLTYETPNPQETLFLVGKGVTYDTGGADIKAGGVMAGMSRDKCGAAAVGGFMKLLAELQPKNIKVVGIMSMVRNSVGENSYVSDEMIRSRAGPRVRVGNTDAEGRMIMADPLCYAKELAVKSVNPHLMTIATLTGHAYLTVGPGYSIVLDNAVAGKENNALKLVQYSEQIGDPFELSTIRREDYKFHKGKTEYEDIMQANNLPSSRTPRGHQGPAGFLILASGLDKYGVESECPIKYSHIDIAGSAGDVPEDATGSPILALYSKFLNNHLSQFADN